MNKKHFQNAESAAHENFSNYAGDEWNYFNDPYNYADGGMGQIQDNAAASIPFVINVQNTSTDDVASVQILGSSANLFGATNFGNSAAIVITMTNGSITYTQFLEGIKSQPFNVGLMHLQSANASQPFQSLTISYSELNGRSVNQPVVPILDPMQNQSNVTIVRYQFPVNSLTAITTTILASATLTLRLFPSEQLDIARSLSGQSVGKGYVRPNLSQFSLPVDRPLIGR